MPSPRERAKTSRRAPPRRRSHRGWGLAILFLVLASARAAGQLTNDEVPRQRIVPPLETLRAQIAASRFRLGPVRLLPRFSIDNAGYDSNVFGTAENPVSDWTATVSAGARLILPVGPKMFWVGDARPQYTWYRTLTQRDDLGGIYDSSFLFFFNRLSAEAGGSIDDTLSLLNSETETQVRRRIQAGRARIEVDLTHALSAFVGGDIQKIRVRAAGGEPEGLVDAQLFDRTEEAGRGGLRLRIAKAWSVSIGLEGTRTTFDQVPEERDNRTVAYLAGVLYTSRRLFVNLSGGYRVGRPQNGSTFPEFSTPTGSYYVSYRLARPIDVEVYGARKTVFGQTAGNPYYIESRIGAALSVRALAQLSLRVLGEVGNNDYPAPIVVDATAVDRRDQYHKVGGGITLGLGRALILSALVERPTYTSNVAGQDRSILRFTTGLTLREEITR